jgi:biopolymer transport protein ExbB/TolQ
MSEAGLFELIKDWILVPAAGLAAWAWNHNEAEHKSIRDAQEKLREASSEGASKLNDKFMEHIDYRVNEAIKLARDDDSRIMVQMEKIATKLDEHARRSEDRHVEMLSAIHEGLARKADK